MVGAYAGPSRDPRRGRVRRCLDGRPRPHQPLQPLALFRRGEDRRSLAYRAGRRRPALRRRTVRRRLRSTAIGADPDPVVDRRPGTLPPRGREEAGRRPQEEPQRLPLGDALEVKRHARRTQLAHAFEPRVPGPRPFGEDVAERRLGRSQGDTAFRDSQRQLFGPGPGSAQRHRGHRTGNAGDPPLPTAIHALTIALCRTGRAARPRNGVSRPGPRAAARRRGEAVARDGPPVRGPARAPAPGADVATR